jgi:hypothetical protein
MNVHEQTRSVIAGFTNGRLGESCQLSGGLSPAGSFLTSSPQVREEHDPGPGGGLQRVHDPGPGGGLQRVHDPGPGGGLQRVQDPGPGGGLQRVQDPGPGGLLLSSSSSRIVTVISMISPQTPPPLADVCRLST